eukprot:9017581-Pyramimonas_sp.AAC.1
MLGRYVPAQFLETSAVHRARVSSQGAASHHDGALATVPCGVPVPVREWGHLVNQLLCCLSKARAVFSLWTNIPGA